MRNRLPLYLLALLFAAPSCKGASAAKGCAKAGKGASHAPPVLPADRVMRKGLVAPAATGAAAGDDLVRGAAGTGDDLVHGVRSADDLGTAAKSGDDLAGEVLVEGADVAIEATDIVSGDDEDDSY